MAEEFSFGTAIKDLFGKLGELFPKEFDELEKQAPEEIFMEQKKKADKEAATQKAKDIFPVDEEEKETTPLDLESLELPKFDLASLFQNQK